QAQLEELDRELIARTPSPALRKIGQDLGRMLLRATRSIVPAQTAVLDAAGPVLQQPLAYGVVAAALGLDARDAAGVVLYEAAATPAVAAVKLLSIDPFATHRCLAELAPDPDEIADRAAAPADTDPHDRTALSRLRADTPLSPRPTIASGEEPFVRGGDAARIRMSASAAGPVGGDTYVLDIHVGAGSTLLLRDVGATLVLPGPHGRLSRWVTRLRVEEGGTCVWIPAPVIAARGCRHQHVIEAELDED